MRKLVLLFGVFSVILIGCSTPYQSSGFRGGFKETRLDDNSFMVDFRGNGFTSKERAYDFSLLRASELTLEYGYKYFIVMSESEYSSEYTTQSYSSTNIKVNSSGNKATATTTNYGGHSVSKPSAKKIIVCFKEKPKQYALVYNAKYVMSDLSQEYGIKMKANLLEQTAQYVGARSSNIYHLKTCKYVKNIEDENLVFFESNEDAERQGYRSCITCKP